MNVLDKKKTINIIHNIENHLKETGKCLDMINVEEKKFRAGIRVEDFELLNFENIVETMVQQVDNVTTEKTIKTHIEAIAPIEMDIDFI